MATSVRDTIKGIVENHLKKEDGLCFGQCLTAVGLQVRARKPAR